MNNIIEINWEVFNSYDLLYKCHIKQNIITHSGPSMVHPKTSETILALVCPIGAISYAIIINVSLWIITHTNKCISIFLIFYLQIISNQMKFSFIKANYLDWGYSQRFVLALPTSVIRSQETWHNSLAVTILRPAINHPS